MLLNIELFAEEVSRNKGLLFFATLKLDHQPAIEPGIKKLDHLTEDKGEGFLLRRTSRRAVTFVLFTRPRCFGYKAVEHGHVAFPLAARAERSLAEDADSPLCPVASLSLRTAPRNGGCTWNI